MKYAIATIISTLAVATISYADGFNCNTVEKDLHAVVYNNVNADMGTRAASRMILSNPQAAAGSRTISVFTDEEGTLTSQTNKGAYLTYTGNVDLRFSNITQSESVLGAALADVDTLKLHVYFKYGQNLAKGEEVLGLIDLAKRDGTHVYRSAVCTRYLKGE